MEAVLPVFALAAIIWGFVVGRRLTGLLACGGFVATGYMLGPPFWSMQAGPVPLNVERLCLAGLAAWFLWSTRRGDSRIRPLVRYDWALLALIGYLTVRCALSDDPVLRENVGRWWRLLAAFWIPAILYVIARSSRLDRRTWQGMLVILTGLGCYLGLTAVAEVTGQWWAVFPGYIANPEIGTHFGRARGPAVMSASLGINLAYCFWAAWLSWPSAGSKGRIALACAVPLMALGVFLTFTRSTWIGLAGGLAIIPILQLPARWRPFLATAVAISGVLAATVLSSKVTALGRKDGGGAEHSVYQRASFTYVSWNMFCDAPLFGHGFGRFYDKKMPYLADRKQQIELESIRGLDHHITPFSLLTETGLAGLTLYVGLIGAWFVAAYQTYAGHPVGTWQRQHGLFALGVLIAYLASALFHDLTLSPTDHWVLFISAGVSVGLAAERVRVRRTVEARAQAVAAGLETAAIAWPPSDVVPPAAAPLAAPPVVMPPARVRLFGMTIDALDLAQASRRVLEWCQQPRSGACRYVVTPNVDHAVMFQSQAALRTAYDRAALVVADGAPLIWSSRWLGRPLPQRVAGSDLVPALFAAANDVAALRGRKLRTFLLGAAPGVAERAARRIEREWPAVEVVGTLSPPLGFQNSETENAKILASIAATQPDLLILGLGAPKQELWIHAHADRVAASVALCVGATIDFLAGEKKRAPRWMRVTGLEWLHRLVSEPRRLALRYARDAWIFPRLLWRERLAAR